MFLFLEARLLSFFAMKQLARVLFWDALKYYSKIEQKLIHIVFSLSPLFCNATSNHHIRPLLQFHNFSIFKLKNSVKIRIFIKPSLFPNPKAYTQTALHNGRSAPTEFCKRLVAGAPFSLQTHLQQPFWVCLLKLFSPLFSRIIQRFFWFLLCLGFVKNGIGMRFWGRMVWFLKAAWVFEEIGWEERSCFGLDFLINFCSRKPHSFLNSCCFKFFGKAHKTITITRIFRRFCINTRFLSKKTSNRL